MKKSDFLNVVATALTGLAGIAAAAQTTDHAWFPHLGYHGNSPVPFQIQALSDDPLEKTAVAEFTRQIRDLYAASSFLSKDALDGTVVVGTTSEVRKAYPDVGAPLALAPDAYWIRASHGNGKTLLVVAGGDSRGALYGTFALLRSLATGNGTPTAAI